MVKFDAYTATTVSYEPRDLINFVMSLPNIKNPVLKSSKGFHTFGQRLSISDDDNDLAAIQWGGYQKDRVMIEVKGPITDSLVPIFRENFIHRVTRVDSCADFDSVGIFDNLLKHCVEIKKQYGLKGSKAGDWEDFPEDGRTLYLGAPTSAVRARLYEKGLQKEYSHLPCKNWVRIEVQVRPVKEAKATFSALSASDIWGASNWSKDLAGRVLEDYVDPHSAGGIYKLSSRDAALRWMCKQYGKHLVGLANDLGGWDCLGLTLKEIINSNNNGK